MRGEAAIREKNQTVSPVSSAVRKNWAARLSVVTGHESTRVTAPTPARTTFFMASDISPLMPTKRTRASLILYARTWSYRRGNDRENKPLLSIHAPNPDLSVIYLGFV